VSRVRRPAILAGVLALVLALPTAAGADPGVPDENLAKSVRSLDTGKAVRDIDLSKAVVALEEEHTDGDQVTVRLSADVLFDFGKAALTAAARRRIADFAPRLRAAKGTIQVAGHSDSMGDPAYNLSLSEQRAKAVESELRQALKGTPVQIQAKGYGETKPIAPNEKDGKDDPEARAKNRRVEITYDKT
jgi:outer membrane protein OmpA-like peptidoglycan-associated protein